MRSLFVLLPALCASLVLAAKPLPEGPGQAVVADDGEPLVLFTYKPPTYTDGPLLVVFHGVGRNAEDYRNFAINLAAPLTLYLGTGDVTPERNFDGSAEAMKQGASRLERGRNCFEFARKLAAERGWAFNWRKVETRGIGHQAAQMFAAAEAADALFGAEKK